MARKGIKQMKYVQETIEQVLKERKETGKSFRYLAEKYGIPKGTIITWDYKSRKQGTTQRQQRGRPKQDENTDYKEKYEKLFTKAIQMED